MREVKFRVRDMDEKRWIVASQDTLISVARGFPKGTVLEQYTGFHDVDGKEIYEGDIIEYFDWCYASMRVRDGRVTPLFYTVFSRNPPTDYYDPLIGVVEWNEEYATYEPLIFAEDDYHGNCFMVVCREKERLDSLCHVSASYCKVIGNKFENPELVPR